MTKILEIWNPQNLFVNSWPCTIDCKTFCRISKSLSLPPIFHNRNFAPPQTPKCNYSSKPSINQQNNYAAKCSAIKCFRPNVQDILQSAPKIMKWHKFITKILLSTYIQYNFIKSQVFQIVNTKNILELCHISLLLPGFCSQNVLTSSHSILSFSFLTSLASLCQGRSQGFIGKGQAGAM